MTGQDAAERRWFRPASVEYRAVEPRPAGAPPGGARRAPETLPGMAAFSDAFRPTRKLLVGGDGIDVGSFLAKPVAEWLRP